MITLYDNEGFTLDRLYRGIQAGVSVAWAEYLRATRLASQGASPAKGRPARDLEMRRPTVWSMMHRIRGGPVDDGALLSGLVEMDEVYVGGKPCRANCKNDHDPKPPGRGTSKTPVVGAVERGGRVKAKAVQSAEMGADIRVLTYPRPPE